MNTAEPAHSRLSMAATIMRIIVLLLIAAAIGLALEGWLYGADAEWPHHSIFGVLAVVAIVLEALLGVAAAASGASTRSPGRFAYALMCLFMLLAAGASYVTLAVSGPEPNLLGVAIAPIDPDMSVADAASRYLGVSLALGDFGAMDLAAASAASHRIFAAGIAVSFALYFASLLLQATRPANGVVLPALSGENSPEAQAFGGRLRFGGGLIVSIQLLITVASGLMFQLAQPGRSVAGERLPWYSEPIGWGLVALTIMAVSLALAFLYTRLSKRIIAQPERHLDPRRLFALWFLSLGILVGFFGVLTSFVAVTMSVWTLIGKIVSQPPGIAITDPTNFIRMLDMLILIANIGLLVGHMLGVGVTQWLRIHASKARLDMLHALVAARNAEAENANEAPPETPKLDAPTRAST